MPTENCYRCGQQLPGYFQQLCDECRDALVERVEKSEKKQEAEADDD